MSKTLSSLFLAISLMAGISSAAPILFYDSNLGATQLERIDTETDSSFVASSDASTSIGSNTTSLGENTTNNPIFTATLGTGKDMQYRFGGDNEVLSATGTPLVDSAESAGNWVGLSFTAAQDQVLNEVSFQLYVNSANANAWSARDAGLFVRIGNSGSFTQFGQAFDSTSTADQGVVTFNDGFPVASGDEVQLRLAFTDKTNVTGGAQTRATRVGSLQISAAVPFQLTVDNNVPAAGPVSHATNGSFTRTFGQFSNNPYFGRGQTFTTASTGDANHTRWSVNEIALRSKANQSFGPGDKMRVWVFEWLPIANANDTINWDTDAALVASDGLSDGDPLNGTTIGNVLVDGEDFTLPSTVTNGNYLHFELGAPLELDENRAYGAFFEFIDADGSTGATFVQLGIGSGSNTYNNGKELRTTATENASQNEDLTFFVSGTPIPGPPATGLAFGSPFQNGMILQRDKAIKIWGRANPNEDVSVTLDTNSVTGTADDNGDWTVTLPSLSSGGPFQLSVTSDGENITLSDVLIGDVWITFGQSNMVRPLNEMIGRQFYIDAIRTLPIRCLKIDQRAAISAQTSGSMTWLDNSNPASWTSVGAVFAYRMQQATGVPTAIIWAAWGSTSIEAWLPVEMTSQLPHFAAEMADYYENDEATVIAMLNGSQTYNDVFVRTRPNIVYNQMMHPLLNYGISGFVWYQGEANAGNIVDSAQYRFTLPKMVTEYRKRFDQGDLPFLGVQLPSFNNATWPWFREAQNELETLPEAHVAVTIDTGQTNNIHPLDKEPIGIRLSLLARKYVYGEDIVAEGPTFEGMSIDGNEATITFEHDSGLTTTDGLDPSQFTIAGSNQNFVPATSATLSRGRVILSASSIANPVAVRYAWSPAPKNNLNLVNGDGLPAAPFRTDNFALPGLGAQAPQGIDDSYETARDNILDVPVNGVFANDIDLNRDVLTTTLLTDVSSGTLTLAADGSFVYQPESGFAGTDTFSYQISDGSLNSDPTTVTIDVTGLPSNYYLYKEGVAWAPGADESPTGDPDNDGITNFLEFALASDPTVPSLDVLPSLVPNGDDFDYVFNNTQAGVQYDVLLSTDLITWSDPPFASLTSSDTTPVAIPDAESVDGRLFIRLRVSE